MRNEVTVAMGHSMGGHWFWLDHLSPEALRPIWIVLGLRTVYSERPGQPKHGTFSVHCDKHTDGFDGHGNSCDTLHRRWSLVLGHLSPEALRPIWIDLGLSSVLGAPRAINTRSLLQEMWKAHRRLRWTLQ
ncbi:uncharacterized protein LOC142589915 isoform X13 [Dermacentor variabilis]|uniref:uncharacterized protein LOC142589915 isoform X13 n=1 Tax=Dermacentor variabilis TaxID=34621 RepID=UPI003F5C8EE5